MCFSRFVYLVLGKSSLRGSQTKCIQLEYLLKQIAKSGVQLSD